MKADAVGIIGFFVFALGDRVVHRLHGKEHSGNVGLVVYREWFEDQSGKLDWYGVRWMDPHGKIADSCVRMSALELVEAP